MSDTNKDVVTRVTEVMMSGKPELAGELFAPALAGKQAGLAKMLLGAFPDLTIRVDELIAEGDRVACQWKATGTQKGPMLGIPATNTAAAWTGTTIYGFVDGKIADVKTNWDSFELVQQLHAAAKQQQS